MKKIILLISLVSLLFISCENSLSKIENPSLAENSTNTPAVTTSPSEDGKTYITFGDISFENESRTINPVYNRDHLTALYIKGMETNKVTPTTKPNDYTTLFGLYSDNPKATSYEDLCTKTFEITPGVWNFILYATLYDFEFSGMTTVEVIPGMTHALSFTLATTNTSSYPYGIIDITVDFTGNADRVVATLKEKSTSTTARITKTYTPTDTKNPISTVEGETFKRINFKTANTSSSSSGGVTAGKYYLLFEFFQDGFDEPINTVENIVRVENNFTTKTRLNLDLDELYTIDYSYWEGSAGFDSTELEALTFTPTNTVLPSVYSRKSETFTLPTPSLPGYSFDAWYKDTDFTEENKITSIEQGSTGNLELYANFIPGVTLKTGTAINTIFQKLGGVENPVITDDGTATSDTTITAFAKSTTAPSSAEYYLDESSIIPVWLDGTTIYYYKPEGCTLYLNSDSSYMFCQLKNITSIDTTDLNTSNVTNMYCLFNSCEKLSTVDLSSFDTSKVTNMAGMFGNCTALSSVDLSSFNTQNVTTMCNMFVSCKGLTVLDLSSFDTRSLENTAGLVGHMTNLTKIYVDPDKWNMTKVTESTSMFWECQNLVGGNGTTCSNANSNVSYAHVDVEGNPGYLTDIADKPAASNDFVTVTGGTFSTEGHVGTIENDNDYNAGTLTIPNLEVCSHLVTQYEYEQLMTYYGVAKGNADLKPTETSETAKKSTPAYFVTWLDAIVYCNLLSESKGLTPVYSLSGNNEITEADSPWTDWGHIAVDGNGKYYYNQTDLENHEETSSYDTDGGSFSYDLSANGYRLPTTAEYQNIKTKNPGLISGGYDEWCQNYNYSGYRHCYFDGTNKIPKQDDEIYSDYRANNMGFRVVRNAGANGGSNP